MTGHAVLLPPSRGRRRGSQSALTLPARTRSRPTPRRDLRPLTPPRWRCTGPPAAGCCAAPGGRAPPGGRRGERGPVYCRWGRSRSVLAALASTAKRINGRYERFLERTFPRFYVLYVTFTKGIQALFLEAKEIRKIKSKMSRQRLSVQQLPYREMERLRQKALSQVLFLTTHLPAFFLRHRLRSHVLEIRHLDRAMLRLGLGQLSEEELRAACYLRGLNSTRLGTSECRAWLEQWLGLSCKLQASEASLLANSMVLLSLNYPRAKA
uniref:LETM1 domain containing 1 n=1 Tax=Strix occidentalis caurina TaxID=311401 RepID=A0A8D0ENC4_STROC